MMRTARATVTLQPGQRPRSTAAIDQARQALTELTTAEPLDGIRFAGWTPDGRRRACYEADYPDDAA